MVYVNAGGLSDKNFDQIVVKSKDGQVTEFNRPMGGELVLKTEGGRVIIEQTGLFGRTTTHIPSADDSIEARE